MARGNGNLTGTTKQLVALEAVQRATNARLEGMDAHLRVMTEHLAPIDAHLMVITKLLAQQVDMLTAIWEFAEALPLKGRAALSLLNPSGGR